MYHYLKCLYYYYYIFSIFLLVFFKSILSLVIRFFVIFIHFIVNTFICIIFKRITIFRKVLFFIIGSKILYGLIYFIILATGCQASKFLANLIPSSKGFGFDNPNTFYNFGLSNSIRRKALVFSIKFCRQFGLIFR